MDQPALQLGSRVDDYEVERLLSSEGAFGLVYLAHDHRPGRIDARRDQIAQRMADWKNPAGSLGYAAQIARAPSVGPRVVIKEFFPSELAIRRNGSLTVAPQTGKDQLYAWSRSRFLDESSFLLRHAHPNVVSVFDVLSANNTQYMVMEFLDGGSLYTVAQSSTARSEAEVRRWLLPVLRALQSTERKGVDHLDLSPQNVVFRNPGGDPVLIDFGAARMDLADRNRGSRLIVNDGYSAPEKYHQTSQGLTARADVYAVAGLVNFALTGERPAAPMERLAGPARARGLSAAALAERERRASAKFLASIDACFDMEPRRRPADAAALEKLLEPWGAPAAVSSGPKRVSSGPPTSTLPANDARRQVLMAFLGLLILLLLLLLIGPALAAHTGGPIGQ